MMPDKTLGSNIVPLHPRRDQIEGALRQRIVAPGQKRCEQAPLELYRLPDGSLIRLTLRRD